MKYIKSYEKIKNVEIGGYVITNYDLKEDWGDSYKIKEFQNNNIGQIIDTFEKDCIVQYNNIPSDLNTYFNHRYIEREKQYKNFRVLALSDKFIYSKNLKDLDMIITRKKYNL